RTRHAAAPGAPISRAGGPLASARRGAAAPRRPRTEKSVFDSNQIESNTKLGQRAAGLLPDDLLERAAGTDLEREPHEVRVPRRQPEHLVLALAEAAERGMPVRRPAHGDPVRPAAVHDRTDPRLR